MDSDADTGSESADRRPAMGRPKTRKRTLRRSRASEDTTVEDSKEPEVGSPKKRVKRNRLETKARAKRKKKKLYFSNRGRTQRALVKNSMVQLIAHCKKRNLYSTAEGIPPKWQGVEETKEARESIRAMDGRSQKMELKRVVALGLRLNPFDKSDERLFHHCLSKRLFSEGTAYLQGFLKKMTEIPDSDEGGAEDDDHKGDESDDATMAAAASSSSKKKAAESKSKAKPLSPARTGFELIEREQSGGYLTRKPVKLTSSRLSRSKDPFLLAENYALTDEELSKMDICPQLKFHVLFNADAYEEEKESLEESTATSSSSKKARTKKKTAEALKPTLTQSNAENDLFDNALVRFGKIVLKCEWKGISHMSWEPWEKVCDTSVFRSFMNKYADELFPFTDAAAKGRTEPGQYKQLWCQDFHALAVLRAHSDEQLENIAHNILDCGMPTAKKYLQLLLASEKDSRSRREYSWAD